MSNQDTPCDPLIFLSVDIAHAATEMIEVIGALGVAYRAEPHMVGSYLNDLRSQVAKAQAAVTKYDRLPKAGEPVTRRQFNGEAAEAPAS